MCSLDGSDQSDSSPHVHVAIERSRVRHFVFGSRNAQDGLQVTRLPKDPSLWRQSIPTKGPELHTHTLEGSSHLSPPDAASSGRGTHLDVFNSTADQAAGLNWVPGHIEDLQDSRADSDAQGRRRDNKQQSKDRWRR